MNASPKEIAEQLARKCAVALYGKDNVLIVSDSHKILQSFPLVELLECVESLKRMRGHGESCKCHSCVALSSLDTKLKQILGEQKG